jgi:hypothetical protein
VRLTQFIPALGQRHKPSGEIRGAGIQKPGSAEPPLPLRSPRVTAPAKASYLGRGRHHAQTRQISTVNIHAADTGRDPSGTCSP